MSHSSWVEPACSLPRRVGSATLTTVTSSMSMSAATVMTAMTRAGRRDAAVVSLCGAVRVVTGTPSIELTRLTKSLDMASLLDYRETWQAALNHGGVPVAKAVTPEQVSIQFRKVIAALVLFNDNVSRLTGMSASDSQFLHLLQLHGPMTPSELARRSGLTSGTVTGVIDRLEQLGFAGRERHPSDRRKVVVTADEERLNSELAPHFQGQG